MSIKSRFLLSLSALFATDKSSSAADFCVDSAPEIQSALTSAGTNNQNDVVKIVQGTYAGNFVYASKQANKLSVLGGYTTNCAERLIDPKNTVLDGKQADRVLVLSAPDVKTEFLVQGLTIRNGYRDSDGYIDGQGGGVYIVNGGESTVTIDQNMITGNTGGGVTAVSNTTFTNNLISNNNGGGVSAQGNSTFTNNTISNNISDNDAGGVSAGQYSTLTNNTISNNSSKNSAGGVAAYYGGGALINNTISNNRSVRGTGGVSTLSSFAFTNNTIANNSSEQNAGGVSTSSSSTFINNTIAQNRGSGVRINASYSDDEPAFYNNLFWENEMNEGTPDGVDLTILNADADNDYIIANVILFGNDFDHSPHGLYFDIPQVIDPSNLNKVEPWFVDPEIGDFHLQPDSPVIDAGYPGTPNLPEFDIENTPRVLGESVDIGAYEYDDGSDPRGILAVTKAGNGTGTVTSTPTGINCGNDCFHAYELNAVVTLKAIKGSGSLFEGWSGDDDCADGQVTMDTNVKCTATFNAARRLTVKKAGLGSGQVTSTPTGIDCGLSCSALFYLDQQVALAAAPKAGSVFAGWSGDATCPNPIMAENRTCTATFTPIYYPFIVIKDGAGQGTIISQPAGISCGTDCEQDYAHNTLVTLTATPNAKSIFTGWAGACTGKNTSCKVTIAKARAAAANFEPITLSINDVTNNEGNSGPRNFSFQVSLNAPSTQTVTVNYATADGSAKTADKDYRAASGKLTFPKGVTNQNITVVVNGDRKRENNETFKVQLKSPTGASLADFVGVGNILNDD